ncbi:MAG: ABC transporter ATP-binding protein [Planctomycetaceae bacterium]|nr:ABC transporter ATP-binding protein [Planctomycetaceae bacterium]
MIRITNLSKVHHRGETEVAALRGLTCEIPSGAFTFIVGPSGSGKSTLLYLIGALDQPTSGDIEVLGRPLSKLTALERDRFRRDDVGFVFQSFNLLSNLDAVDNVLVPYLPQGIAPSLRERAISLLNRVGMGKRLHHRPNQLSGGEQQRVAIARALLKQPRLILADEPTGELDSATGAEVFAWLRQLHAEQNGTVIVVTHDHRYIQPQDNILKLRDGRLDEAPAA